MPIRWNSSSASPSCQGNKYKFHREIRSQGGRGPRFSSLTGGEPKRHNDENPANRSRHDGNDPAAPLPNRRVGLHPQSHLDPEAPGTARPRRGGTAPPADEGAAALRGGGAPAPGKARGGRHHAGGRPPREPSLPQDQPSGSRPRRRHHPPSRSFRP